MPQFSHLHCHTQYSVLDGAARIEDMVNKAKNDGMPAVAITDHGNMFGVFEFVNACNKQNILPIVGCEFYIVEDMTQKSFTQGNKDKRYHQLLLAKDSIGYQNLSILCSRAFLYGKYGKFPRIDMELLEKHTTGLIATSCCIGAKIPQTILTKGEEAGEKELLKWHKLFGDDFYLEMQRHNIQNINNTGISQEDINQILLKWSKKYDIPVICTNDSHYLEEEDAESHDILLCVNTKEKISTPIKYDLDEDDFSTKGRFGFANNQFFFKTRLQMESLFKDVPFALENTQSIVDKIQNLNLFKDVLMPNFEIPKLFKSQSEYLKHLVYEGAKKLYGDILSIEVIERLELELKVISKEKFEGYFLIIEDFLQEAKKLNVWIGPGRGSASGSAVAYCLGITKVDPLKYNLLFERFLNPERISFPDIDIDIEEIDRQKVIDYVVQKYGRDNVSQIITFGTMKEKSSIKDVGRAMEIPLDKVNKITNKIPPKISLEKLVSSKNIDSLLVEATQDTIEKAHSFKNLYNDDTQNKKIIDYANKLNGSIRNTGVHACGIIIAPDSIENIIPVCVDKNGFQLTQYDNRFVEDAGLLKMDFLGLKTLNVLKSTINIIKKRTGQTIDIDNIPLDDPKTFELFQKGKTIGIFQFESPGMKKHLIDLKPNSFLDLIAMNALYRPGPMQYIPKYINRKHGREAITIDIEESREILTETYGVLVYQEQVMLLSQKLANFSKGQADILRKAMGKKKLEGLAPLFELYINGCTNNGINIKFAENLWKDMEEFTKYAFNKSHATCYALIAYQCAYLKANYLSEFMAGQVSNNMDKITEVAKFMSEAKQLGIKILGPDINESSYDFTVNNNGDIRFGLSAIKGVGENLVKEIETERYKNGKYTDIYNFVSRFSTTVINKRALEPMAFSGVFDSFDIKREHFVTKESENDKNFITKLLEYNSYLNDNKKYATNLFGESLNQHIILPTPYTDINYSSLQLLEEEKNVLGFYLSGHPLDSYKLFIENCTIENNEIAKNLSKDYWISGICKDITEYSNNGKKELSFTVQSFNSEHKLKIKNDNYIKYEKYIKPELFISVKAVYSSFQNQNKETINFTKILDIQLLENYYSLIQRIDINFNLIEDDIDKVQNIKKIIENNQGKTSIYINLIEPKVVNLDSDNSIDNLDSDNEENIDVKDSENDEEETTNLIENSIEANNNDNNYYFSRKYRVNISDSFINEITENFGPQSIKLSLKE